MCIRDRVKGLVLRRRFARHAFAGCGAGHDHGPPWARHRGWGRRRGPGGSFWLRAIFSRLDTTPGQEKEIRSAIEELQDRARDARDGLKTARADVASAIRGEIFDEAAIAGAGTRADATAGQVKDAILAALRRIHAVLDDKQRERLADLFANGPGFGRRWGGPYRS